MLIFDNDCLNLRSLSFSGPSCFVCFSMKKAALRTNNIKLRIVQTILGGFFLPKYPLS